LEQTWRWYGPEDPVTLAHVKQAGATGVVTALHDHYTGEIWPRDAVQARRDEIARAGLGWSVVESLPVHDAIKLRNEHSDAYTENFKANIRLVAEAGVETICYNFMPVVDWTRTDLTFDLPSTGQALRFDIVDFAAYDVFILQRPGAEADYKDDLIEEARQRAEGFSEDQVDRLERNVISGLPGSEANYDRNSLRERVAEYDSITPEILRDNLIAFLQEIIPVAEEQGVRMCLHPDDPPFSLFGLPRVVSTAADYRAKLSAVDSRANGVTFCTGSLGVLADNDLVAMIEEFGPRIHFVHLRNVTREGDGSFHEAEHLAGSSDMIAVVRALMNEEGRRRAEGRADANIPMRPDHGHVLLDDLGKDINPGYSGIGRLKGLAELRGVMEAISALDLA
jgi:mannonate dehydratase